MKINLGLRYQLSILVGLKFSKAVLVMVFNLKFKGQEINQKSSNLTVHVHVFDANCSLLSMIAQIIYRF